MPEDFYYAIKFMDEAISGTFTEETKRFWAKWEIVKEIFKAGKRVDVENTMKVFNTSNRTAYNWLCRFEKVGLIEKREQPLRGRKAKTYYVQTTEKKEKEKIVIDMQELCKKTTLWFKEHGVDEAFCNFEGQELGSEIFREKIEIPISTFTIFKIIKMLSEAPKEDEVEDSSTIWR
jgi:predicted transcriptional regulator